MEGGASSKGQAQAHPQAGEAQQIQASEDALGFSIPLTAQEVRGANLRRAVKKAKKRRGHVPDNLRHYLNTAEIVWHKDGGATIVWEE